MSGPPDEHGYFLVAYALIALVFVIGFVAGCVAGRFI